MVPNLNARWWQLIGLFRICDRSRNIKGDNGVTEVSIGLSSVLQDHEDLSDWTTLIYLIRGIA